MRQLINMSQVTNEVYTYEWGQYETDDQYESYDQWNLHLPDRQKDRQTLYFSQAKNMTYE